jgi:hypothetical protein
VLDFKITVEHNVTGQLQRIRLQIHRVYDERDIGRFGRATLHRELAFLDYIQTVQIGLKKAAEIEYGLNHSVER